MGPGEIELNQWCLVGFELVTSKVPPRDHIMSLLVVVPAVLYHTTLYVVVFDPHYISRSVIT
jgi:hypothetical protein